MEKGRVLCEKVAFAKVRDAFQTASNIISGGQARKAFPYDRQCHQEKPSKGLTVQSVKERHLPPKKTSLG